LSFLCGSVSLWWVLVDPRQSAAEEVSKK